MDSSPEEKRAYRRYAIWFPVTLEVADGEVWCICRDASPGGLRVSSRVELPVGHAVVAVFKLTAADATRRVPGRIARSSRNDDDVALAFPVGLAIEFDEPLHDIEPHLAPAGG